MAFAGATIDSIPRVGSLIIIVPDQLKAPESSNALRDYLQRNINKLRPSQMLYVAVSGILPAADWPKKRREIRGPYSIAGTEASKSVDLQIIEWLKLADIRIPPRTYYSPSTEPGSALTKAIGFLTSTSARQGPHIILGAEEQDLTILAGLKKKVSGLFSWNPAKSSGIDFSRVNLSGTQALIASWFDGTILPALRYFTYDALVAAIVGPLVTDQGSVSWGNMLKYLVTLREREPRLVANTTTGSGTSIVFNYSEWVIAQHREFLRLEHPATASLYGDDSERLATDMARKYLELTAYRSATFYNRPTSKRVQYPYLSPPLIDDLYRVAITELASLPGLTTVSPEDATYVSVYQYLLAVIPWRLRGLLPPGVVRLVESLRLESPFWEYLIENQVTGPITVELLDEIEVPIQSPSDTSGQIEIAKPVVALPRDSRSNEAPAVLEWQRSMLF